MFLITGDREGRRLFLASVATADEAIVMATSVSEKFKDIRIEENAGGERSFEQFKSEWEGRC